MRKFDTVAAALVIAIIMAAMLGILGMTQLHNTDKVKPSQEIHGP